MADILEFLSEDSPAEQGDRPVRIITVLSLECKVRYLFSAQIFDMVLLSVNRDIIRDIRIKTPVPFGELVSSPAMGLDTGKFQCYFPSGECRQNC
jgi:hypothetical protein